MTKQEEIREGLISKVKSIRAWATRGDDPLSAEDDANDILNMLHSQGVVIKVDRELPENHLEFSPTTDWEKGIDYGYNESQQDMLKVGYIAVEPLIKKG